MPDQQQRIWKPSVYPYDRYSTDRHVALYLQYDLVVRDGENGSFSISILENSTATANILSKSGILYLHVIWLHLFTYVQLFLIPGALYSTAFPTPSEVLSGVFLSVYILLKTMSLRVMEQGSLQNPISWYCYKTGHWRWYRNVTQSFNPETECVTSKNILYLS